MITSCLNFCFWWYNFCFWWCDFSFNFIFSIISLVYSENGLFAGDLSVFLSTPWWMKFPKLWSHGNWSCLGCIPSGQGWGQNLKGFWGYWELHTWTTCSRSWCSNKKMQSRNKDICGIKIHKSLSCISTFGRVFKFSNLLTNNIPKGSFFFTIIIIFIFAFECLFLFRVTASHFFSVLSSRSNENQKYPTVMRTNSVQRLTSQTHHWPQ